MDKLPNELIEIISFYLSYKDKKSFRLVGNSYRESISKMNLYNLIFDEVIAYTYVPLHNCFIPFGLLLEWSVNYPFLSTTNDLVLQRRIAHWMAIKCMHYRNKAILNKIIEWANNYKELYINN